MDGQRAVSEYYRLRLRYLRRAAEQFRRVDIDALVRYEAAAALIEKALKAELADPAPSLYFPG